MRPRICSHSVRYEYLNVWPTKNADVNDQFFVVFFGNTKATKTRFRIIE